MSNELERVAVIGIGVIVAGAGLYYLLSLNNSSPLAVGSKEDVPSMWPTARADPNIVNAYNRAKYRDNTLRADEIYKNPPTNFTNDFLSTYAPTVKQMNIPVQQL